jgi:hypothetical protein
MDIDDVIRDFVFRHSAGEIVYRNLKEHFRDFDGKIVRGMPEKRYSPDFRKMINDNISRATYFNYVPVSAVLYVYNGAKIIEKFYGKNRLASSFERHLMRKYYPPSVKTLHAEYDAVRSFMKWYNWKEPSKNKKYDLKLFVVRNHGALPSRPCKYCMRMLKSEVVNNGHTLEVIYPIDGRYFGIEKIE